KGPDALPVRGSPPCTSRALCLSSDPTFSDDGTGLGLPAFRVVAEIISSEQLRAYRLVEGIEKGLRLNHPASGPRRGWREGLGSSGFEIAVDARVRDRVR